MRNEEEDYEKSRLEDLRLMNQIYRDVLKSYGKDPDAILRRDGLGVTAAKRRHVKDAMLGVHHES